MRTWSWYVVISSTPSEAALTRSDATANNVSTSGGNAPYRSIVSSRTCVSDSWSAAVEIRRYRSRRSASCPTHPGGMNAFTGRSMRSSFSSGSGSPFISATDSARSRQYVSNPTAAMCPCCSAPSRLPAPRISRSRIAIWKPLPSDWCWLIAARRSCASSVSCATAGRRSRRTPARGAPDAPAQLVHLRQAEQVRRASTTSVFAFGTSRPLSMITLQTSTSASRSQNFIICLLEVGPRPSGRARPRRARPGAPPAATRPAGRSSRRGCGPRRPARRGAARDGPRASAIPSSYAPT